MMRDALYGAPWLSAMARVFEQAGAPLYIVGGAVRNPLMGLPISDVDVCGPTRPEDVCAFCEGTEIRAHLRAAHFGTVELHMTDADGKHHMAEYTTWREDSYRCGHRPESVKFTNDIRVDARRRDFSVNALYRRAHDGWLGDVLDPTGGLRHMRLGVLHTVTRDPDQVLGDDGLRILRAARFQAEMDLKPTEALVQSLARNAHLLGEIACERLRDELQKTLMADLRYPMLSRRFPASASGLLTIRNCGAWPYLFGKMGFDDEAVHVLIRLHAALPVRMALLLHRENHKDVENAMLRMRFSVKEARQAADCVKAVQSETLSLFEQVKLGRDALESALAIFRALQDEASVHRMESLLQSLEGKPMTLRELAVNGSDVKPLFEEYSLPMREMGGLLENLWRGAVEGEWPNEAASLLEAARQMMNKRC